MCRFIDNSSVTDNTHSHNTRTQNTHTEGPNASRIRTYKEIYRPGSGPNKNLQSIARIMAFDFEYTKFWKILNGKASLTPDSLKGEHLIVVLRPTNKSTEFPKSYLGIPIIFITTAEFLNLVKRKKQSQPQ